MKNENKQHQKEALELAKLRVEIALKIAQTNKLKKEAKKISIETVFYPFLAGATFASGLAAIIGVF